MNHIETVSLPVQIVGVSRVEFLFEIKGRIGIILAGDGQHGVQRAFGLRIARSKQLDIMSAPVELPAKMVDDSLRAAVGFRRHGDIYARDLCDFHGGPKNPFYNSGGLSMKGLVNLYHKRVVRS